MPLLKTKLLQDCKQVVQKNNNLYMFFNNFNGNFSNVFNHVNKFSVFFIKTIKQVI